MNWFKKEFLCINISMTDFVKENSTQNKTEDSDETDSVTSLKLSDYIELKGWDDIPNCDMECITWYICIWF